MKMCSKKGGFHLNHTTNENSKQPSIFRGLILAILAGVTNSIAAVIVKQMKNLHPGQLALYRFIAMFTMCMPDIVKTGHNTLGPRKLRILLVLRGIFGGLTIFFNFLAFRYLGLGEANVIIFSSPVIVTIFARIFLKEPCNIFQLITVILTLIGVIFTAKLPSILTDKPIVYSSEKIYGLLAATISLFTVGTFQILTRQVRSAHATVSTFYYSSIGTLEIAIVTALFGNFQWQQCGIQNLYILILAVVGYAGVMFLAMAMQCECAGPAVTVKAATEIGLAFLWQILFFHDVPDTYGIIGAVLVFVSVIVISLGKWLTSS